MPRKAASATISDKKCTICHQPLHVTIAALMTVHPTCASDEYWDASPLAAPAPPPALPAGLVHPRDDAPFETAGPTPLERAIKAETVAMIRYYADNAARSLQTAIGPSQLGNECARAIAYQRAGTPPANVGGDPWPAVVGTAIHAWMHDAVNRYRLDHGLDGHFLEQPVQPADDVSGTADAYWDRTVRDWKSAGVTAMKDVVRHGAPRKHLVQANLYGLGFKKLGYQVDSIALVYLPRSGWLKDVFVHAEPFDEDMALTALERMYRIDNNLTILDVAAFPERWAQVPAAPSRMCTYCPFFKADITGLRDADQASCPGR